MTTKDRKVFYCGINDRSSFRPNEHAEITGVEWVTPDGLEGRACFRVKYADGVEDTCPISDPENYRLVSSDNIQLCKKLISSGSRP